MSWETQQIQGHSLSLSVTALNKDCDIWRDTMATVSEICLFVKYSPKRENLLEKIYENINSKDSEPLKILKKLFMTRWAVHGKGLMRIIDNYESLLEL